MPGATRVPGITRRLAATLTSVVLLAAPASASAADTIPPRVSGVTLSGWVGVRASACVWADSNPRPRQLPVVTLRLSEPATVTLAPLPILGTVPFRPAGPVSVQLPAGQSVLQFTYHPSGIFSEGAVPLATSFFGKGAAAVLVTARDAAGNRTLLPAVSNPILFGYAGGFGQGSAQWPCDAGPSQQSKLNLQVTKLLLKLLGG